MSKQSNLLTFVRAKASAAATGAVETDWQARKQAWVAQVERLYASIREWLAPLEREGIVRFHDTSVPLNEEPLEPYQIAALHLFIGKQKISLYPKGMAIVGVDGRVDVRGPRAVRSIVLLADQWQVIDQESMVHLKPFTQKTFQEILNEVME